MARAGAQAGADAGSPRARLGDTLVVRRRPVEDVSRYSRFVGVMKVALPLVALALVLVLALWPKLMEQNADDQFVIVMKEIGSVDDDLRMIAPSYRGTDASGRVFSVDAASAVPDSADPDEVALSDLSAGMTAPDGTSFTLTAPRGVYFPRKEQLRVEGEVRLTSGDGHVATGSVAHIDMAGGTVVSDAPVSATGPYGTLDAGAMTANQSRNVIRFEKGVRLTVVLRDRDASRPEGNQTGVATPPEGGN